jgi:hypothetical protein
VTIPTSRQLSIAEKKNKEKKPKDEEEEEESSSSSESESSSDSESDEDEELPEPPRKKRGRPARAPGREWSEEDLKELMRLGRRGDVSWEAVAQRFDRSLAAVKTKFYVVCQKKVKGTGKRSRSWTDDDIKRLHQLDADEVDYDTMAAELGRSVVACRAKLRKLEEAGDTTEEEEPTPPEEKESEKHGEERAEYEVVREYLDGKGDVEELPQVISWSQAERLDAQVRSPVVGESQSVQVLQAPEEAEGRTRWSEADILLLQEYRDVMRLPWENIAKTLKRSVLSCQSKYRAVLDDADKAAAHSWTPEERDRLVELRERRGHTFREIGKVLGVSKNRCSCMYYSLVRKRYSSSSSQIHENGEHVHTHPERGAAPVDGTPSLPPLQDGEHSRGV